MGHTISRVCLSCGTIALPFPLQPIPIPSQRTDARRHTNVQSRPSHHGRRSANGGGGSNGRPVGLRAPFGRPVSVNFGRPDIEKFIAETVQGTAVERMLPSYCGDVEAGWGGGKFRASPPTERGEEVEVVPPTKLRTVRREPLVVPNLEKEGSGKFVGWLSE